MHVGIAIVVVLLSWWQSVEAQVTTNTLIYGARGTSSNVGSEGCYYSPCPLGNLVADMALKWCGGRCNVAFFDGAEVDGSISPGQITSSVLNSVLPTGSTLVTFNITGAYLFEAFMNFATATQIGAGAHVQIAGATVIWNPVKQKVLNVAIAPLGATPTTPQSLLNLQQTYPVVTSQSNFQGAQGYFRFQRSATSVVDSGITLAAQLLTYLGTATQPFAVTRESLQACMSNSTPAWSSALANTCRVVASTQAADIPITCPTDFNFCRFGQSLEPPKSLSVSRVF